MPRKTGANAGGAFGGKMVEVECFLCMKKTERRG